MSEENKDEKNEGQQEEQKDTEEGKQEQQKEATHQIKVNGETREVTLKEALELAQKSASADERFQEASKMKQEASEGIRYKELVTKLRDDSYKPSEAEVRELASLVGADPDDFLQGDDDVDDSTNNTSAEGIQPGQFSEMFQKELGMPLSDAKAILAMSHESHIDTARNKIRGESNNAVDKDEILGKMMIGEHGKDRAEVIKEMVAEDVFKRITNGEPYGPELVAASVQKTRAYLSKFGQPGTPDLYPSLGQGPSLGLSAAVQSETPIKRISASEDADGSNFVARFQQKLLSKIRSERK